MNVVKTSLQMLIHYELINSEIIKGGKERSELCPLFKWMKLELESINYNFITLTI